MGLYAPSYTAARMQDKTFSSSAYGTRTDKEITIAGRSVFDMLKYMFRNCSPPTP